MTNNNLNLCYDTLSDIIVNTISQFAKNKIDKYSDLPLYNSYINIMVIIHGIWENLLDISHIYSTILPIQISNIR